MGYHKLSFDKGVFGELSKIQEELDELEDAKYQKVKILEIVELSDLYGAVQGYLEKYHPEITMEDLKQMSDLTQSAFKDGSRKSEVRIDNSWFVTTDSTEKPEPMEKNHFEPNFNPTSERW